MIFTNCDGKIVEIKRQDYINDSDYYSAIIFAKGFSLLKTKSENDNKIMNTINKYTRDESIKTIDKTK